MTTDWSREFGEPITLPKGHQLVTLRDAALYITKLPKAEQHLSEWQAAPLDALSRCKPRRVPWRRLTKPACANLRRPSPLLVPDAPEIHHSN